jgi:acyl-CoA synthetase (AMP-forming)/AMP-acid ligase II
MSDMLDQREALSGIVGRLDGEQTIVSTSGRMFSVDQLLEDADALYRKFSITLGSRIALCGLSACDLIRALVAFDGKVSAMVLLPVSLDDATTARLILAAGCTHIFNGDGISLLPNLKETFDYSDTDETKWLLPTSGTTGLPKLIGHTLASLSTTVKRDCPKGRNFIWGLLYDPCRFAGLQVVLQALLSGSMLSVSLSNDFDLQVKELVRNRVNALSATPSLWRKMLIDGRIKVCKLRQVTLGGEIADQQLLDGLRHSFPEARIVHIYASTEAGTVFSVNDCRAGFPAVWLKVENSPIPLRIRDDGHLLIKPAKIAVGREIASLLDADGYLDTEDIVQVEGDRIYFLGRASGAINVGGNKVNPEYVEQGVRCVEGVLDVRVFGKKNSIIGQLVAAEVVTRPGIDTVILKGEILSYCRLHMENWQIPVIISFVDELKENTAGKRKRIL